MSISPKLKLYEAFAGIGRALGHAHRLDILEHLAQGERGVEALAAKVGLTTGNTSQHLQLLKHAGLVESRRDGKFILYRLSGDRVLGLIAALFDVGEHNLAEVDKVLRGYFHERDAMEPVSHEDLIERSRDGLVTVLDVRPEDEFRAGHLPGAVNMQLEELESRLAEIDPGKEVIAYCRGPYCVLSFEAVAALRKKGIAARRLEDGLPEWRAAGLPLEHS
ncbi:ArsR/SmtB family transcription factor [Thiosulfatihalobacter marinus]|uniref:ArsR/SmtB family transcription factor n=1 Tax=Thiosulfatihalobacter marinus TaxID=2792481 RepID=UPI0018D67E7A|nr:metalloregulator ArsR/SmtB family transcription factor [Thiosulfatihalobacter marinus]